MARRRGTADAQGPSEAVRGPQSTDPIERDNLHLSGKLTRASSVSAGRHFLATTLLHFHAAADAFAFYREEIVLR